MDSFRKQDLQDLLRAGRDPAISIYVSTTRTSSDWEGDRLRFRAALTRARELLERKRKPAEIRPLLEDLEPMLDDQDFWLHQADGLAVFRSDGFSRVYRLPVSLPELVVVGPTFHTRPLIQLLEAPDRFWILGLSQKDVRLWEGTLSGIREVDRGSIPASLTEAVARFVDYEEETFYSSGGRGRSPRYHGHGPGQDALEWELEAFLRKVDEGLRERIDADGAPVILAGVEADVSAFRAVSKIKGLADDAIRGNVSHWNADRLHKAALPIVERLAERKVEEALRLWESAFAVDKTEMDLSASARLAIAGRVRLLMTERDRRIWGELERDTGAVRILREGGDDPGTGAVDLLDELAEVVILRGGDALALPEARMPTGTGVATILR